MRGVVSAGLIACLCSLSLNMLWPGCYRKRHNTTAAERSSIALSAPKASSAGLRAMHAAETERHASTTIQTIVMA